MSRKYKKVCNKIILGITTVMLMFSVFAMSRTSHASNVDSAWTFNLSINNASYQYTDTRVKDSSSKMYFYWERSVNQLNSLYVCPFAVNAYGGRIAAAYSELGIYNFRVTNEGQYRITNYVYENNYTKAALGLMGCSGYGTASGYWSPDTATNYPVLQ